MAENGKAIGTDEVLAVQLDPGIRGASSAQSHIEVLNQLLAQLADDFYDEPGNLYGEKIWFSTLSVRLVLGILALHGFDGGPVLHLIFVAGHHGTVHSVD